MSAPWPRPREERHLRPYLAACYAIRGASLGRPDYRDVPPRGVLAELAHDGRQS